MSRRSRGKSVDGIAHASRPYRSIEAAPGAFKRSSSSTSGLPRREPFDQRRKKAEESVTPRRRPKRGERARSRPKRERLKHEAEERGIRLGATGGSGSQNSEPVEEKHRREKDSCGSMLKAEREKAEATYRGERRARRRTRPWKRSRRGKA
jgi:hypothetical protein